MAIEDNASIAMIPAAYGAEKVYSVIPSNGDGDFTFDRNSSATRINKGGFIEVVGTDVPRLSYPLIDGVVQSCPHLILERGRTNYVTDTEDFSVSGWIKSAATATLDSSAIAPDGTAGVYQFAPDTTNNNHQLRMENLNTNGDDVVFSVFAKAGTERYLRLRVGNTTDNPRVWFDLEDGIVENEDVAGTGKIENYGNGWFRCIVINESNTLSGSNGQAQFFIQNQSSLGSTGQTTYTGDASKHVYLWGAQWENTLPFPTTYLPSVSGIAASRSVESCEDSGTADDFNDSEGVLFAEAGGWDDRTDVRMITISDSGTSSAVNSIRINWHNSTSMFFQKYSGSTRTTNLSTTLIKKDLINKIAVRYDATSVDVFCNGIKILTNPDTSSFTNSINTLSLSGNIASAYFYGKVKQTLVFKNALSDSDLVSLTSWDSFNDMAKSQEFKVI